MLWPVGMARPVSSLSKDSYEVGRTSRKRWIGPAPRPEDFCTASGAAWTTARCISRSVTRSSSPLRRAANGKPHASGFKPRELVQRFREVVNPRGRMGHGPWLIHHSRITDSARGPSVAKIVSEPLTHRIPAWPGGRAAWWFWGSCYW